MSGSPVRFERGRTLAEGRGRGKWPAARDSGADRGERSDAEDQDPEARIRELHRRDVDDPEGRWFLPLGGALRDQGRPEEAAAALRQGLARDPECLGAWVILGQCYAAMGETEVARSLFESIATRDRENSLALRGLAEILARRGERRRAADYYRALLKVMPRDLGAQEALAGLLESTPSEEAGRQAAGRAAKAVELKAEAGREEPKEAKAQGAADEALVRRAKPSVRRPEPSRRPEPRRPEPRRPQPRRRPVPHVSWGPGGLPPESRPKPGIFEPPPADLDWGARPGNEPANEPAVRSGGTPEGARGGYWRWLTRIAKEEEGGESDSSPRVGKE
jgi:tetratricopeptide (TPR) repeat protein